MRALLTASLLLTGLPAQEQPSPVALLRELLTELPNLAADLDYEATLTPAYAEFLPAGKREEIETFFREKYDTTTAAWVRHGRDRYHCAKRHEKVESYYHFDGRQTLRYQPNKKSALRKRGLVDLGVDPMPDVYFLEYENRPYLTMLDEATIVSETAGAWTIRVPDPLYPGVHIDVVLEARPTPRIARISCSQRVEDKWVHHWTLLFRDFEAIGKHVFPATIVRENYRPGTITGPATRNTVRLKNLRRLPENHAVGIALEKGTLVQDYVAGSPALYYYGFPPYDVFRQLVGDFAEWCETHPSARPFGRPPKERPAASEPARTKAESVEELDPEKACGLYCLAIAAELSGVVLPIEEILGKHPELVEEGASIAELERIAESHGLHAVAAKKSVAQVIEAGVPAILAVRPVGDTGPASHFVVAVGVKDGRLIVMDAPYPARVFSNEWLAKHWAGAQLAISSTPIAAPSGSGDRRDSMLLILLLAGGGALAAGAWACLDRARRPAVSHG